MTNGSCTMWRRIITESTNLAEKYPKKLEELQKLWFKEAKKYGALPLTDVFIEGFISVPC